MRYKDIISEASIAATEEHTPAMTHDLVTDDEILWEMSNIFPKNSGLPVVIWVSSKGGARHGCRIKVSPKQGEEFCVTVPDLAIVGTQSCSSKDLRKICEFIQLNEQALVSLWNLQIDLVDFVRVMKKVT